MGGDDETLCMILGGWAGAIELLKRAGEPGIEA
jgi:hypothetical protein